MVGVDLELTFEDLVGRIIVSNLLVENLKVITLVRLLSRLPLE